MYRRPRITGVLVGYVGREESLSCMSSLAESSLYASWAVRSGPGRHRERGSSTRPTWPGVDMVSTPSPGHHHSAASTYAMQFAGLTGSAMRSTVWKIYAPPKCKFCAWLAINDRLWTTDRLQPCGLQIHLALKIGGSTL
jgi:hypothetical protein